MVKTIKNFLTFFIFSCVLLSELHAEQLLIWEDCILEAKRNNPQLISAREKLNQTMAEKGVVISNTLPQITSEAGKTMSKTATAEDRTNTYTCSITGKQLVFDGFKTGFDILAAQESIKSAEYNYRVASSNLRLRLRTAFVELLKAQELLNITDNIARRRKENVELVKLRYEAGREHKGSLLSSQADLAQAEFEAKQARRNIDLAERQLTKELGRTKFIPVKVNGDFEVVHTETEKPVFETLAETNPFLQDLIARKEKAGFSLKSAKADFFPKVYVNTSTTKSDSEWPPDKHSWSLGISASLPLFEGGSRIADVSKAKTVLNQAEAEERSGRDSVIFTLEDTWTKFQDAIDKVEVQKKFLEGAEERAKITYAQYSIGLISFDNWTIIENNLASAQKFFLDSRTNALITEANWIQAKGGVLEDE